MANLIERYGIMSILSRDLDVQPIKHEPTTNVPQDAPRTDNITEMSVANDAWLDEVVDEAVDQAVEGHLIDENFSLNQFMDEGSEVAMSFCFFKIGNSFIFVLLDHGFDPGFLISMV